jgi:hypothetical protein
MRGEVIAGVEDAANFGVGLGELVSGEGEFLKEDVGVAENLGECLLPAGSVTTTKCHGWRFDPVGA